MSQELAELLDLRHPRREGDAWLFPSRTDRGEPEHRVELLSGRLFCTCLGFIQHRKCKHIAIVREEMESNEVRHELALAERPAVLPELRRSPAELHARLEEMKLERNLVQDFFRSIMEEGQDYGIIPGTQKPTLFKAGAEKLCELYGYAPVIKDQRETVDNETGYYRCVITLALVQKGTGAIVAEGVGECNTREARYYYRWVSERELPEELRKPEVKATLKRQTRKGRNGDYTVYRLENDDLHTLWNTVLKMAKKRALVDATLSATRSSGIFTQSMEEIHDWIEGDFTEVEEKPAPAPITDAQRDQIKALYPKRPEAHAELRRRWPHAFPEPRPGAVNKPSALTEAEAAEVIAVLSAPAGAECQHEAVYDQARAIKVCGKCGAALEGPDGGQEALRL